MLHFPVSTVLGAVAELRIAALRAQGLGWKRIATDSRLGGDNLSVRGKIAKFRRSLREVQESKLCFSWS